MTRRLIAELVGTAVLVFFGCGTATVMFGVGFGVAGTDFAAGVVVTALAFGLVLVGLAYAFGPVSGAHVNPAVTLGMVLARRLPVVEAVGYWVAQFIGGVVGALALWGVFRGSPRFARHVTGLGADGYGAASRINIDATGAFIVEVVLTAVFVYVILAVTAKGAHASTCGLVIGLTLTLVHLLGISVDGTSVNPARALGPALFQGGTALHQVWLFVVAPLVGGALAALVFDLVGVGRSTAPDAGGALERARHAAPA
ncbi:MAG TPA: aquaporin [Acidimicrobiales bacterium]|nr:aquaporin [Acidimicrobiales bacterium]